MGKPVCPIISGNPRYFGLTQIEWAFALFLFFFVVIIPSPLNYLAFVIWISGIVVYPKIARKFEDNFVVVLIESIKIPSTIIGHFRRALPPLESERNHV